MDIFGVTVFLMFVTGCRAPACEDNPVAVWPLGTGNGCTEIITGDTLGTIGKVEYVSGFTEIGMNSSTKFSGENNSYVDLNVSSTDIIDLSGSDFSIWFYINFDSITSGTFLHYRSYSYDGTLVSHEIREFKVSISGGLLNFNYSGFGSVQYPIDLNISDWYNIVIERDFNKDGPKVYLNDTGDNIEISSAFPDVPTIFPGTMHLGGNFEGDDQFSGKIACFQFIPCKQATHAMYDEYCLTQQTTTTTTTEQPTTTSTTEQPTTTTTTDQPTTTSTTEQPTTTSTTDQPTTTTTTEQPTTTSTTEQPTTTTTTEQPTTTSTNEQPTTTSTTDQPTTTTTTEQLITTSTTEQSTTTVTTEQPTTTTTKQPITTSTTEQPTTTSTTEQPTTPTLTTEQPTATPHSFAATTGYSLITDICYHFTLTGTNVTFRFNSDIIDIIQVPNIVSCSDHCRRDLLCFSFTIVSLGVSAYECRIGLKSPLTISRPESMLFEL